MAFGIVGLLAFLLLALLVVALIARVSRRDDGEERGGAGPVVVGVLLVVALFVGGGLFFALMTAGSVSRTMGHSAVGPPGNGLIVSISGEGRSEEFESFVEGFEQGLALCLAEGVRVDSFGRSSSHSEGLFSAPTVWIHARYLFELEGVGPGSGGSASLDDRALDDPLDFDALCEEAAFVAAELFADRDADAPLDAYFAYATRDGSIRRAARLEFGADGAAFVEAPVPSIGESAPAAGSITISVPSGTVPSAPVPLSAEVVPPPAPAPER